MYAGSTRFRPLSAGEVVGQTFQAYRRLWRQIIPIPVVLTGAVYIAAAVTGILTWYPALRHIHLHRTIVNGATEVHLTGSVSNLGVRIAVTLVLLVCLILLQVVQTCALVALIGQGYVAGRADWRSAVALGFRRLGSVLLVGLLTVVLVVLGVAASVAVVALLALTHSGALIFLGFLLIFAGWVYTTVSFSIAYPVLMLDGQRGWSVFGQSFRLVRGRWWATVGTLFLVLVISSIAQIIVQAIVGAVSRTGAGGAVVAVILSLSFVLLTAPLFPIATTFLFFDLKNRKEGVDLSAVARRLEVEASGGSTFGPGVGYPPPGYPPPGYPPPGYPPPGYPPPGGYPYPPQGSTPPSSYPPQQPASQPQPPQPPQPSAQPHGPGQPPDTPAPWPSVSPKPPPSRTPWSEQPRVEPPPQESTPPTDSPDES